MQGVAVGSDESRKLLRTIELGLNREVWQRQHREQPQRLAGGSGRKLK